MAGAYWPGLTNTFTCGVGIRHQRCEHTVDWIIQATFACFLSVLPILEREEPGVLFFSSALFVANIFILLGKGYQELVCHIAFVMWKVMRCKVVGKLCDVSHVM